jgi:glycosyltransferase involved in cell wall biosynthesis
MLVAIDGNEANIKNRVGVNIFSYEIIKSIYQLKKQSKKNKEEKNNKDGKNKNIFVDLQFRIFLQNKPLPDMPEENEWWQYEVFGPKKFWTWTGLVKRLYLKKPRPDVLFSPSHYGPFFSPIPFAISIMDLGFLRWPEQFTKKDFFQLKYWTKLSAKKANKIFTISEFSKKDILDKYKIDKDKVEVIYPAIEEIKKENTHEDRRIDKIGAPYIIYLGTLKPSKNIKRLIKAFNNLKKENEFKQLKLVIAGKKGWLYKEIFALIKKLNLENEVIFTGFVSEEKKKALIKQAEAFVLPSLWEGFGIPVLEAMQLGTPVVCSKTASLPEVAGNAAIYIKNSIKTEEIDKSLRKVLKLTQNERKKLINRGYKRVKMFNWYDSAEKVVKSLSGLSRKK